MAYYRKVLRPGEVVRVVGRLHWVIYLQPLLLLGLAVVLGIAWLTVAAEPGVLAGLAAFALVAALLGGVALLVAWIRRVTTEIVVTDLRVLTKTGLFARRSVEMNMGKIETVDVRQGVTARMLGYGTVVVRGTGAGLEPLARVARPIELRNAILVG